MQMGSPPRPGRQSPTPEPPGAARAHFDRPAGQTPAAPGEPGVAQEVPDRGDDLTPCPLRARSDSEPGRTAVAHGQADIAADLEVGRQSRRPRRPSKQRVARVQFVCAQFIYWLKDASEPGFGWLPLLS